MQRIAIAATFIVSMGAVASATWWMFRSRLAANIRHQRELKRAREQGRLDRKADGPPGLEPPKPWK